MASKPKKYEEPFEDRMRLFLKLREDIYAIQKRNNFKRTAEEDSQTDVMTDLWYKFDEEELVKYREILSTLPEHWNFRTAEGKLVSEETVNLFFEQDPVLFTEHLMKKYQGQKTYFGHKIEQGNVRLYIIISNHPEGKPKLVVAMENEMKHIRKLTFVSTYKTIPVFEDNV
jgi:hypothetical protein